MTNKRKLILDCDPGTDDSLCIIMGLLHPEVELLAITAESGNLRADVSSANARRILEYMGCTNVPVCRGILHSLVRPHPADPYSHGEDGLGNHFFPAPQIQESPQPAAMMIVDQVLAHPGEVTLVCTAPLTNVALAMMLKPEIIPLIKEIYHLGGAYGVTEYAFLNATGDNPMSEWNVYVDPEAAKVVYGSGAKVTTIGLDIAFNPDAVNIGPHSIRALGQVGTKASKYALEIIAFIDKNNSIPERGVFNNGPIDTGAMCAFLCPEIIQTREIRIAVDTGQRLTRGMTIWDRRLHFQWEEGLYPIRTAVSMDSEKYQEVFVAALSGKSV
ncbi:MAG: nucleoside hydrolase [Peptococcaceae bacterium]|jgi:purine nucleosidase/pyrimidine-specific ribonucleoside hydrolase|nr:nucleoside hydrolase [Peptococcaceae bacterium]